MNLTPIQSAKLDRILTHKIFGFLIFLFLMWLMFFCTFTLGKYPQDWIEKCVELLSDLIKTYIKDGALKDLLIDGIISGVGSVIVFLPNIVILFLFISIFEESGYMKRAANIMDGFMHKIGLHGQSFLPLLMGFGCNVPAILATQTVSKRNDKMLTMLVNPFMSCSARLPVYILLIGAFFPDNPVLMLVVVYLIGIAVAIIMALILRRVFFRSKSDTVNLKQTLPPYRIPTIKSMLLYMWEKSLQYLKKIGGVVLVAVIIIWALNYFPRDVKYLKDYDTLIKNVELKYDRQSDLNEHLIQERDSIIKTLNIEKKGEHQIHSYLGRIGQFVEPVMSPLGYDWKISIALLSGVAAKEFIVSSLGVIYQIGDSDTDEGNNALISRLQNEVYITGDKIGQKVFNKAVAMSLLVFALLYFPCIASVAAIRKESGSWGWALFSMFYTTGLAWLLALVTYRIALLFI